MANKVAKGRAAKGRRAENDIEIEEDGEFGPECYLPFEVSGRLVKMCRASEVPDIREDWIWNGRVAAGHVTAIVGPRGAGKSFLIAEIAARLSNGHPWPDDPTTPSHMAEILIITGEDEVARDIKPRLRACGADLTNIHLADFRRYDGTPGKLSIEAIEELALTLEGLRLIVIDPFAALVGERNDRRDAELRALLHQLARMANRYGFAIILVNATDKLSVGKTRRHDIDVVPFLDAGARAVWTVEEDPAEPGRLLWLNARNNLAGDRTGLAFRITGTPRRISWDPEPVELRAHDLQPAYGRETKVARAADWLRAYLQGGVRMANEVRRDATLAGITRGALYDAKSLLGVLSDKETDTPEGRWHWCVPGRCQDQQTPDLPQDSKISAADDVKSIPPLGAANIGSGAGSLPAATIPAGTATPPGPPLEQRGNEYGPPVEKGANECGPPMAQGRIACASPVEQGERTCVPPAGREGRKASSSSDNRANASDRRVEQGATRNPGVPRSARRKGHEDARTSGMSPIRKLQRVDIVRPAWMTGNFVDLPIGGPGLVK